MVTGLEHIATHDLHYAGDCHLRGIASNGQIYAEEIYGEDDWLAQHRLHPTNGIIETIDEASGNNLNLAQIPLPDSITKPTRTSCCPALHFTGARLRGMRIDERIEELVYPLSMEDKIQLTDFMEWDHHPTQLIGLAESTVLAHVIISTIETFVCRRLRIAYRLKNPMPSYDYDSLDVYLFHRYNPLDDVMPELVDCLNDVDDVVLLRPMDCLVVDGRLYIADGGENDEPCAIHIFNISTQAEAL